MQITHIDLALMIACSPIKQSAFACADSAEGDQQVQYTRIISEGAMPLSSAYAQLRTMAPSPLKSPRLTPRYPHRP